MSQVPKEYSDVEEVSKRVSAKAEYPIRNFKQLADALGGEEASFDFKGRGQKLGELKKMVPEGFFPVDSHEDLIAKVGYLMIKHRLAPNDHTPGEQRDKAADDAGEPPPIEEQPSTGAIPALKGTGKKEKK
jgi:hypothetical protein